MRSAQEFVGSHPRTGFAFGRGEAWGLDCVVAAYALGSPVWRSRIYPWFEQVAVLLSDGQASCSGFIQASMIQKNLNGQYRTRQQIEQSITESVLVGLRECVFRGKSGAYSDLVRDVLRGSLRGFISDMVWGPFRTAPAFFTAVRPANPALPIYCSFGQMPSGAWSPNTETYQIGCSYAWGYELTGDMAFLDKARLEMGRSNLEELLTRLEGNGVDNIENRAALLALVQRLVE